jgi:Rod binding domain-containing protein
MSGQASSAGAGLPAVNQALEPAWVRHGPASTQKAYDAALSFEQTLVEQLARSLTATSDLAGESSQEGESASEEGGSSPASATSSELSSLLPQALSSGVMNAGGLGLAAQLTQGLQGTQSTAPKPAGAMGEPGASTTADAQTIAPAASGATGGTDAASTGGSGS